MGAKMGKCKILKIVKNVIFYLIIISLVALCLFVLISKKNGKPPFFFGYSVMWVKTESMAPEIPQNSYILTQKITAEDVCVNDIITFSSDDPAIMGCYNTHRVIGIIGNNEEFVTKGDNNVSEDKYTAKANSIVAKYVKVMPALSGLGKFLSSPIGMMSASVLMLGAIILLYLPDVYKMLKNKQNAQEEERKKELDRLLKEEIEKLKNNDSEIKQ